MLVVFHLYCLKIMRELRARRATHSAVFYRWINEIPALLLVAIVLLVVTKPV
jgi:putative membrane protein